MIAAPSSVHSSPLPTVPSGPPAHCCKRWGKVVWRETYVCTGQRDGMKYVCSRSENATVLVVTT